MNVWLVGMPGSGKSTVGRIVAERLGSSFRDTDREVERRGGRTVTEVFERDGEEAFRALEYEVVAALAEEDGLVVSCGGGVVLDPANREAMRRTGTVVLLELPPVDLAARLRDAPSRPPLAGRDPSEVWEERLPAYRAVAHRSVDASGTPAEVAERVLEALP